MEILELTTQRIIAVTGSIAAFFSQCRSIQLRKWACIIALIGEPFWFYATYTAEQWGIFAVCFLYTLAWLKGFKLYWIDKND